MPTSILPSVLNNELLYQMALLVPWYDCLESLLGWSFRKNRQTLLVHFRIFQYIIYKIDDTLSTYLVVLSSQQQRATQ